MGIERDVAELTRRLDMLEQQTVDIDDFDEMVKGVNDLTIRVGRLEGRAEGDGKPEVETAPDSDWFAPERMVRLKSNGGLYRIDRLSESGWAAILRGNDGGTFGWFGIEQLEPAGPVEPPGVAVDGNGIIFNQVEKWAVIEAASGRFVEEIATLCGLSGGRVRDIMLAALSSAGRPDPSPAIDVDALSALARRIANAVGASTDGSAQAIEDRMVVRARFEACRQRFGARDEWRAAIEARAEFVEAILAAWLRSRGLAGPPSRVEGGEPDAPAADREPDGPADRRDIAGPGGMADITVRCPSGKITVRCPSCPFGTMLVREGVAECRRCGYSELIEDGDRAEADEPIAVGEVS